MIPKKLYIILDDDVQGMVEKDVVNKGIDKYIQDELVRCDCSRIVDGMRLMQTIGMPYRYEISRLVAGIQYALNNNLIDDDKAKEYKSKLEALHRRNLKYEETNPPIIYDKKKRTTASRTTKKKKAVEGTLKGFEKAPTAKQINAQVRANLLANLKLGVK